MRTCRKYHKFCSATHSTIYETDDEGAKNLKTANRGTYKIKNTIENIHDTWRTFYIQFFWDSFS